MRSSNHRRAVSVAVSCVIISAVARAAVPPGSTAQVHFRAFPGLEMMDGNWAALFAASDGKVYAGLAYHGGDGHFVYYDSKTDRMHDVGNITVLCGESLLKRGPQSKIHAKFGEGKDGRIYFGTHVDTGGTTRGSAPRKGIRARTGWRTIRRPTMWRTSACAVRTRGSTLAHTTRCGTAFMG
jgi:hypothetical protein